MSVILNYENRDPEIAFPEYLESDSPAADSPPVLAYHDWKRPFDRMLALLLLIPGLPLIGILSLLVRLTSRGPAIYRQVRVGRRGRIYTMYKLRSMRSDAEKSSGPAWSQKGDPRITPLGRLLRKLHLDELPQLFNVVRGEMALIGPRPERPEFVVVLGREIPGYLRRIDVLPGVTGLAQINLPPDTDLDSVRRKLVLDTEYIDQAHPWLDARILLCTLLRVAGLSGQLAMRATRLQRDVALPTRAAPTGDLVPETNSPSTEAETPAAPEALLANPNAAPNPLAQQPVSVMRLAHRPHHVEPAEQDRLHPRVKRRTCGDSGIQGSELRKPR